MDPKELRIGNIVWDDYSGEMIVFGIITGGINPRAELRKSERLPAGSYAIDKLQPIQLTEEWLIKFGFIGDSILGNQTLYKKDNIEIWAYRNDKTFIIDNIKRKMVYITTVHQLQNIFFALTGEELEIKI